MGLGILLIGLALTLSCALYLYFNRSYSYGPIPAILAMLGLETGVLMLILSAFLYFCSLSVVANGAFITGTIIAALAGIGLRSPECKGDGGIGIGMLLITIIIAGILLAIMGLILGCFC